MKLSELINLIDNGSAHILLYEKNTGIILLKTIWYNLIPEEYLSRTITKIAVKDYELKVEID